MKIETIFSEVFAVPDHTLDDSTELNSIPSWDSMAHMILITRLEEVYSVQLSGDEIADIRTIGDARLFLARHGADV